MYLRYQVISSISKIYETYHDGNMKEMMKSPLTESTEIGLEGVEHFSPETGIVTCPANIADLWNCGIAQMDAQGSLSMSEMQVLSLWVNAAGQSLSECALLLPWLLSAEVPCESCGKESS